MPSTTETARALMRGRIIRIERHRLGMRLHLLGVRVHEWHLGATVLGALAAGALLGRAHLTLPAVLAAMAGGWLLAKDWHDLVPTRRNTASWTLGLHRRPHPLRRLRRADPLPKLAAAVAVIIGVVNLVSALTPDVAWRGHALLALEPLAAMRLSHALAIPAASMLLVASVYLVRRRRRALYLAVALLVTLAVLNVLKGLDLEEAAADIAAAARLVRAHGSDTLAYFKLRRDKHYLFSADARAFVGYRIVNGVMLVSGDPVGPHESVPAVLRELADFAERRGLKIAALGASEKLRPLFEQLGLRSLYIGDEAVVATREFSLEGRPIRKVRQSVSRLEKAGYKVELVELSTVDEPTLEELDRVSAEGRAGATERGFSMALDGLRCADPCDTVVAIARDEHGRARAFLQFVPSYGRAAVSLSFMRRERETPNGLMEYLVVRSIEALRARGVDEVSLNFAAFARIIKQPSGVAERAAARALSVGDRFFQIESLYRFNAKFFPRWEPRYFMFDGLAGFPRAAVAGLRAEGQLPLFSLRQRSTREPPTIASRPSANRTSAFPFPS